MTPLPYETRRKYAEWREVVLKATNDLAKDDDFINEGEDLADWIEMMETLMSFSPHPGPPFSRAVTITGPAEQLIQ